MNEDITGAKAKEIRQGRELTQKEFWGSVGVQQSVGHRYEAGVRIPRSVQMLIASTYQGAAKPVPSPRAKALHQAHQALDRAQAQINDARNALSNI